MPSSDSPRRWLVTAQATLEHESGPRPSEAEVSQAVADRLGDGAYHLHVEVAPGPDAEDGDRAFGGARVIPITTTSNLAHRVDRIEPGGFIQLSRAWYAEANLNGRDFVDEVSIGDYAADEEGVGDRGEFCIRWRDLQPGRKPPSPQLCMFDEAWGWLTDPAFIAFVDWLTEQRGESPTPEVVCEKLRELGFRDETPEQQGSSGGGALNASDAGRRSARGGGPSGGREVGSDPAAGRCGAG